MSTRLAILLTALVVLLAKLGCAALTRGTNDADAFYNFGRFIWEHGLIAQYRANLEFNHTPLTGWFCALIYGVGNGAGFNFLLRLPGIVADFAAVAALVRWRAQESQPRNWSLLVLALSPVSFMVSGYHGNLDAVLACLLVLAAVECRAKRPAWCGLWLGLACNVKIVPLLVAPVFFFHWLPRERAARFFVPASLAILVGWGYPLCTIPATFLQNVLGYSSNWGSWGVTWLLTASGAEVFAPVGFSGLTPTQRMVMTALKVVIAGAALALAWSARRRNAAAIFHTLAGVWLVFFVFAPGVGTQYLVWLAPFLAVAMPRASIAFTATASVFLFVFYNTISGGLPWFHGASTAELVPRWAPWSLLPWLMLVAVLASVIGSAVRKGAGSLGE